MTLATDRVLLWSAGLVLAAVGCALLELSDRYNFQPIWLIAACGLGVVLAKTGLDYKHRQPATSIVRLFAMNLGWAVVIALLWWGLGQLPES